MRSRNIISVAVGSVVTSAGLILECCRSRMPVRSCSHLTVKDSQDSDANPETSEKLKVELQFQTAPLHVDVVESIIVFGKGWDVSGIMSAAAVSSSELL